MCTEDGPLGLLLQQEFSQPEVSFSTYERLYKAVAQLVERLHGMEEARGSIPLSSTVSSEAAHLGWFTLGAWHAR